LKIGNHEVPARGGELQVCKQSLTCRLVFVHDNGDGAFPNRRSRNRRSDALRATGDEHNMIVQSQIHALPPHRAGEI
jgi:hypothetical protein